MDEDPDCKKCHDVVNIDKRPWSSKIESSEDAEKRAPLIYNRKSGYILDITPRLTYTLLKRFALGQRVKRQASSGSILGDFNFGSYDLNDSYLHTVGKNISI